MKSKKIIFKVIIMLLIIFIATPICCNAADLGLGDLDAYKGSNTGSVKLEAKAEVIVSAIKIIGIVVSVVALMIIGIKYMLGSVEEKAEYKKTLIPYIIGACLLFTGSLVPEIIYKFMQNF